MSTFFNRFPTVDLKYSNTDNNTISYTDIYRFVDVDELNLQSFINYEWYEIEDGERPDHVSEKLYGTPNFYWTFFIVNERLKGGYKEWPLSNSALDKIIDEKYNRYGVCNIVPFFITSEIDLMDNPYIIDLMGGFYTIDLMLEYDLPIGISNFLNGLDLSFKWLRVKRMASSLSEKGQWAEIAAYDRDRYQLWMKNVTDSFFFDDISDDIENYNTIQFALYNPFSPGTTEYHTVENEHLDWVESAKDWYNTFFQEYTGSDFKNELISKLKFEVTNFYETGSIAPDYFINGVTGEKICNLYCNITGEGVPIPNYESEKTKNDEKRFIRVIRPSMIRRFVDTYEKVLKESGRLEL